MNDSVLVGALRARDPGALAALYDTYAGSIYRYCWSMVGTPDAAQVALRDTLIAAEAHIRELADPDRLEVWLYALARGECVRRNLTMGIDPMVAGPVLAGADDADLRVMAWNATQSLSPKDREVLELTCRHGLTVADLAAVLRVTVKTAGALYELARERLRDVVTAEVLVRKGPYDCVSRAQMSTGFSGELTSETRERVIRHVNRCDICAPHRVRQVSAGKVFELLPVVALPKTLRVRVMSCFVDPELVPYRRYVARRVGLLDAAGFPADGIRRKYRRPYAMAGAAAAVAAVAAIALIFPYLAGRPDEVIVGIASGTPSAAVEPPGIRLPWDPEPNETPMTLEPIDERVSAYPVGSVGSRGPMTVTRPVFEIDRSTPAGSGPADRPSVNSPRPTGKPDGGPVEPGGRPDGGPVGPGGGPDAPVVTPVEPPRPNGPDSPVWPTLPGPSRAGSPDRHHQPRDHQGRRSAPHRCVSTPKPSNPHSGPSNLGSWGSHPHRRGSKPVSTAPRPVPANPAPRRPRNPAPKNPSPRTEIPKSPIPRNPAPRTETPKDPIPKNPAPANPNPNPRAHLPHSHGKPKPAAPAPDPAPANPNPNPNPQPPTRSDPPASPGQPTTAPAEQPSSASGPKPMA
ncbi:sigma factor-like helix-turn-helix DNA-binding protein [Streptosporangium subroseum]|uniref:RNA polymerase sigma factor n=1 Tax=Streptosporangium subroseum TaxID=106412 RepID=UPI0034139968